MNMKIDNNKTLAEIAYQKLFEAIVSGYFKPGERLVEDNLSKEMGISRTPIREAIKELERDNLVVSTPYKGVIVKELNYREAKELLDICILLESFICREAAKNSLEEDIYEIKNNIEKFEIALENDDFNLMKKINYDFHMSIAKAAHHSFGCELYSNVRDRMNLIDSFTICIKKMEEITIDDHKKILEAIKNNQPDLAAQYGSEHIKLIADKTLDKMKNK